MDQHCSSCGTEQTQGSPKCTSCGAIQDSFVYKSRIAAACLAMFAGIFGGHRFFLGQWWGIFYLLFFWTYIPWLVGVIEGIVFLSTSQKAWNDKYNQGISAGSEKGTIVIICACIFPSIFVLGILAAVALPAYQDYTARAALAESHTSAKIAMQAVETYESDRQRWPSSNRDLGSYLQLPNDLRDSVEIDNGAVYVTPNESLGVSGSIIYVPSSTANGISWSCTESTIESKYLPPHCR